MEQFRAHKVEIEAEFEEIEERKQTIFAAILQKEEHNHRLQEAKDNLEHRVNSLEQESSKYNKLFKEYNETIEAVAQKIQRLRVEEKRVASCIDELQEEERETARRVQRLEKVEIREGLRSLPECSTKEGIARIMEKVGSYEGLEKRLKESEAEVRKLRLENQNMKVLNC